MKSNKNSEQTPILFIFSGLPGVGKSALVRLLAGEFGAVWLRIDTIEQALRDLCGFEPQDEGYRLAYRVAADNLHAGLSVVADSCNPWELTRREWEAVATENGARFVNIEVVCSDREEHRRRVETRGWPAWSDVENREYHPWTGERVIIDTAGRTAEQSFENLKLRI